MKPMLPPTLTERAAEFWSDRQFQHFNDASDMLEAAREQGAESAVTELLKYIQRATELSAGQPEATRPRIFIATLCGTLQPAFYDVAVAIAKGAGMAANLYPEEN